jgi:hypothetical protein
MPSALFLPLLLLVSLPAAQEPGQGGGGRRKPPPRPDEKKEKVLPLVELPEDYVHYSRVPEGGREPRAAARRELSVALLFARGEDGAVDLHLARSDDRGVTFAPSVRVNAEPGEVRTIDGSHGGSVAVGPDGRAHVTWIRAGEAPSIRYARENAEGGFDAPLDLGAPAGLGANAALCVDDTGAVYLFYSALEENVPEGEHEGNRIFLRKASGGGEFSAARPIGSRKHDVSPNCLIAAHVDEGNGHVYVLYRVNYAIKEEQIGTQRNMTLLVSTNQGSDFDPSFVNNWKLQRDPATPATLFQQDETTIACWEGEGDVTWAAILRNKGRVDAPSSPRIDADKFYRSNAAGAANGINVLVAWLEHPLIMTDKGNKRPDLSKPPALVWQVWLREGRMPYGVGRAPEATSPWPPVVLRREKGFTIVY